MSAETKHTPGPWIADGGYIQSTTAKMFGGGAVIVADPYVSEAFISDEEVDANARLIAAAPELLEALIDARDWLQHIMSEDAEPPLEDTGDVRDKCTDAIAKAKGEA
ncbi:MAG TPA: hypothetical protein VFB72_18730 [Verrucomicrobiae bacterium]|nr:hypothetical protein [Verrucomicrobiae bacterium]